MMNEFIKIGDNIVLEPLNPNDENDYNFAKSILQNKDTMQTSSAFAGKIAQNDQEVEYVLRSLSGKPPYGMYKIFLKSLDKYIGFGGLTAPRVTGGLMVTEIAMLLDFEHARQGNGGVVLNYFFEAADKRLETVVCTAWDKNEISKGIAKKYNMQFVKSYQHSNDPDFIVNIYGRSPPMKNVIEAYSDGFASKKVSNTISLSQNKQNYSTLISRPLTDLIATLQTYKTLEENLAEGKACDIGLMPQMPQFPIYQNNRRKPIIFMNSINYNALDKLTSTTNGAIGWKSLNLICRTFRNLIRK